MRLSTVKNWLRGQATWGAVHLGHMMFDRGEVGQAERDGAGGEREERGRKSFFERSIICSLLPRLVARLEVVFRYSHLIRRRHS